jgi:hypothetical protein
MDNIDIIYYINLDHRIDRKEQILQELQRMNIPDSKIERIPALYTKGFGILGCGLSHIKALEIFMKSDYKNCLILEDDFMFSVDVNYSNFLLTTFFKKNPTFDVCMLSGNLMKSQETVSPFIKKVIDVQTTSSYIITKKFAPILISNLYESTRLLADWKNKIAETKHEYCLDIYWKTLQPQSEWYILHPKIGFQRESYSDISNHITDYKV